MPVYPGKEIMMSKENQNKNRGNMRDGFYRALAFILAGLMIAGSVTAVIFYIIAK